MYSNNSIHSKSDNLYPMSVSLMMEQPTKTRIQAMTQIPSSDKYPTTQNLPKKILSWNCLPTTMFTQIPSPMMSANLSPTNKQCPTTQIPLLSTSLATNNQTCLTLPQIWSKHFQTMINSTHQEEDITITPKRTTIPEIDHLKKVLETWRNKTKTSFKKTDTILNWCQNVRTFQYIKNKSFKEFVFNRLTYAKAFKNILVKSKTSKCKTLY